MQAQIAAQASADRRAIAAQSSLDRQTATAASSAANKPPAENERVASYYLSRLQAAEKNLQGIDPAKGRPNLLHRAIGLTGVGGMAAPYTMTPEQQAYRAEQEEWVRAKLRRESGAAIPNDEMEREIVANFPQPGEGPEQVRRKAQIRAQVAEGFKTMAGRAHTAEAAPVTYGQGSAAPVTKTVGGKTYVQQNGQWFEQ
jgi:hypothetical protein